MSITWAEVKRRVEQQAGVQDHELISSFDIHLSPDRVGYTHLVLKAPVERTFSLHNPVEDPKI